MRVGFLFPPFVALAVFITLLPENKPADKPTQPPELLHVPRALLGAYSTTTRPIYQGNIVVFNAEYTHDFTNPPSYLDVDVYREDGILFIDLLGYVTSSRPHSDDPRDVIKSWITLGSGIHEEIVVIRLSGEENRYRIIKTGHISYLKPIEVSNVFIFDKKFFPMPHNFIPYDGTDNSALIPFCTQYGGHKCMEYVHKVESIIP